MAFLVATGYPVLDLNDALVRLSSGDLPDGATVITIDDGFYSTWAMALPLLQELHLPCTLYLTTYYCLKENPVFRLAVQYMFWKSSVLELELAGLGIPETEWVRLDEQAERDKAAWTIIRYAESAMGEDERLALCEQLGERLGVNFDAIRRSRCLSLMTAAEVREAARLGVDVELHTHRHILPESNDGVRREIDDNQQVLESLTGTSPKHFCYPSGDWREAHLAALSAVGVASAVTCDAGFNRPHANLLRLSRFLDGSNISSIVFEAEMSGFAELLRRMRAKFRRFSAA